jgi:hypothetical protein
VVDDLCDQRIPINYTVVLYLGRMCRCTILHSGTLRPMGGALHSSAARGRGSILGCPERLLLHGRGRRTTAGLVDIAPGPVIAGRRAVCGHVSLGSAAAPEAQVKLAGSLLSPRLEFDNMIPASRPPDRTLRIEQHADRPRAPERLQEHWRSVFFALFSAHHAHSSGRQLHNELRVASSSCAITRPTTASTTRLIMGGTCRERRRA